MSSLPTIDEGDLEHIEYLDQMFTSGKIAASRDLLEAIGIGSWMVAAAAAVAEIRRRRAADDAVRIDKAVADAAIALELAREAMMASVGMDCPTYETCMAYNTCKNTLLAAIHVAVTFRDNPAHGRIAEAISKLDVK